MGRTLSDVSDDLGVGMCQVRLIAFAGGVYSLGGEYLQLVPIFTAAIAQEQGLQPYQRAALGSVIFLGMLVGNLCCFMNDTFGRRRPIIIALAGMALSAGLSTLSSSWRSVVVLWCFLGLSYGIGVPTWNALCAETSPDSWRFMLNGISMAVFCAGATKASAVVYWYAPDLVSVGPHWPEVMMYSVVTNCIVVVLAVFPGFVESPRFLVNKRQFAAAQEQLEAMKQQNRRPEVSLAFSESELSAEGSLTESLQLVFSRTLWPVTLTVGMTTFLLNFLSFGQYYALPQVLGGVDLNMSPALTLVVAEVCEMCGYGMGFALERHMGRKSLTLVYLAGAAVTTTLFIYGLEVLRPSEVEVPEDMVVPPEVGPKPLPIHGVAMVHMGLNGVRLFASVGWTAVYTYAGEVFPTMARAAGSGVVIACGRIGSLTAPWIYEHVVYTTGTYLGYFLLTGFLCLVNAALVMAVLHETKGTHMEEAAQAIGLTPRKERGA